jgi:hypothetical protein
MPFQTLAPEWKNDALIKQKKGEEVLFAFPVSA